MTDNYIPYGIEWKKEVAKFPKAELVRMLGDALQKFEAAREYWEGQRATNEDEAFNNFIKNLSEAKNKFKEMSTEQLKDVVGVLMQISAAYMMPLFYSLSCKNGIESSFINEDNGDNFLLSFRKEGVEAGSILLIPAPPNQ